MKTKLKALLCLTSIALTTAFTQSIATFASDPDGEYSILNISLFPLEDASEVCRAVECQNLEELRRIVKANPSSVNAYNERHLTPLHIAVISGYLQIARFLMANNANANAKDDFKRTPLHFAVFNDDIALVKTLVEDAHTDVNAKNSWGFTPYYEAVFSGHTDIADYLLEKGGTY